MRLAIVILNYRTPDLTIGCLSSLQGEVVTGVDRVIVVDNASGDDSADRIEQAIQLEPGRYCGNFRIVALGWQRLPHEEHQQGQVDDAPDRESEAGRREQRRILRRNFRHRLVVDGQRIGQHVEQDHDGVSDDIAAPVR